MEKENKNLPEKQVGKTNEVANNEQTMFNNFDLTGNLPNLQDQFDAIPLDLMADYWTPEKVGEQKRVFFVEIKDRPVLDQNTGEILDLECAFFLEQTKDGDIVQTSNGSKRLVGALISNQVQKGTALLITYLGKKKNKNNAYSSDNWSVKPLIIRQ